MIRFNEAILNIMVKQFLLSGVFGFFLISIAKAGGDQQPIRTKIEYLSDTAINKDSILPNPSDKINKLKYGFKDLFVQSTIDDGINVEQLNPRAINFVEDYAYQCSYKTTVS